MSSRQGQLLLATPSLEDPNFARTVTLIVEHTDDGALGLVLNRPTDITVLDALEQSEQADAACNHSGFLHQGGPCAGPLMVLHTREDKAGIAVGDGVYFSVDAEDVSWLLEHHDGPMRCFVGYAGWGAGQLEAETDVGSWIFARADAALVFEAGEGQWLEILRVISPGEAALIANPKLKPADPSLN